MSSTEPTAGVPRLEVRALSKTFAGVTVLDNAHLRLCRGRSTGWSARTAPASRR